MTQPAMPGSVLEPGRNCWSSDRARRFRCIQDGAEYFRLVRQALLQARQSVFILGWDIAGGIDLLPGENPADGPTRFDELIDSIARRNRRLRCYILIWDYGALYALERDPLSSFRFGWRTPRRVRFGYDDRHPVGGCHHQKVVVIDDALAFSGSMDLTGHRWDTTEHLPEHPDRKTLMGEPYGPYHEVQVMVDGEAAARLGALARGRWRALGVERLPPAAPRQEDLWPAGIDADLTDVDVTIARTMPASGDQPAVRECEALFDDAIAAAKRTIYIENQYFTSPRLTTALARRLAEPDGPEVILATPKDCTGWLETNTMGAFRAAAFKELTAVDVHKRLRLVAPIASHAKDVATFIHSKVMVVDDRLLRVGSANCTNRSMGMDTECDVAVEACDDPRVAEGILRIRNRLLADHTGLAPADVERRIEQAGSLRAFIDAQDGRDRGLAPVTIDADAPPPTEAVRAAVDPDEPIGFGPAVDSLIPAVDAAQGRSPLPFWLLPASALAAATLVAVASMTTGDRTGLEALQHYLTSVPQTMPAASVGVGCFLFAAFWLVPVEVLVFAAGFLFGPLYGAIVALVGSAGAAALGYGGGRLVGTEHLSRWISRRALRMGRQLRGRGALDIAAMRVANATSAHAIHLLSGAGRVPFGAFLSGALVGGLPMVVLVSALGGLFRHTVLDPSVWQAVVTTGVTVLLVVAGAALRTVILIRQFAPAVAGHRRRTEFG